MIATMFRINWQYLHSELTWDYLQKEPKRNTWQKRFVERLLVRHDISPSFIDRRVEDEKVLKMFDEETNHQETQLRNEPGQTTTNLSNGKLKVNKYCASG